MTQHRGTIIRIKDWPYEDRPREKLIQQGPESLTDAELLALILGTGHPRAGLNAVDVARLVLKRFGSLNEIRAAGIAELREVPGLGDVKAAQIKAATELGARLAGGPPDERPPFSTPNSVFQSYRAKLGDLRHERFVVVLLDARNRLIKDVTVARGSLTAAVVHPREVLVHAIRESAAGLILVHNHPSGDPSPSDQDLAVTRRISAAAHTMGIRLLDHVVIAATSFFSFADHGLLLTSPGEAGIVS